MSPEKQRIAIAEACGWKPEPGTYDYDGAILSWVVWVKEGKQHNNCPNYTADLNAMHEAEKLLTEKQYEEYRSALLFQVEHPKHYASATAAQRAEALLKTLGKWEGTK